MDMVCPPNLKVGVFTYRDSQQYRPLHFVDNRYIPAILHCFNTLMKRAIYQGGHAWEQANISTIPRPDLPLLPDIMHNHSTVALGYQHAKEHAVCQQFLSKVCLRAACSLFIVNVDLFTFDMPRAFFGFTGGLHDWNLAFVPQG